MAGCLNEQILDHMYLTKFGTSRHRHYVRHSKNNDNDIAIIKTAEKIRIGVFVQPAYLPNSNLYYKTETPVLISGWGRLYENGEVPNILQAAKVVVREFEDCVRVCKYENRIEELVALDGKVCVQIEVHTVQLYKDPF